MTRCSWPRGKVLGGSSVLNYMLYVRGNRRDYDSWAAMGNYGWSYDEVLPYFIKSEDNRNPYLANSPYHGTGGYLTVQEPPYKTPLARAFIEGGVELGTTFLYLFLIPGFRYLLRFIFETTRQTVNAFKKTSNEFGRERFTEKNLIMKGFEGGPNIFFFFLSVQVVLNTTCCSKTIVSEYKIIVFRSTLVITKAKWTCKVG